MTARKATRTPRKAIRTTTQIEPGTKPRVDVEARSDEFLRAAARTFLERGISASMRDVAAVAGAQKQQFYRIFPSRAALIDAMFERVYSAVQHAYSGNWGGYGSRVMKIYLEAKDDRLIFIACLKAFRAEPECEKWFNKIGAIIQAGTVALFAPAPDAPPGGQKRAVRAVKSFGNLMIDTLVNWLEDDDGLSDEARYTWWANIVRDWHLLSRVIYQLDSPKKPSRAVQHPGELPIRGTWDPLGGPKRPRAT